MVDKKKIGKTFQELVSIDSPSFAEKQVAEYLKNRFEQNEILLSEDRNGKLCGSNTGNLYAYVKGDIEGPSILLSAHMDTVMPAFGKRAIFHENGTITSDGTTVLGADDFAGITAILEAISYLKENSIKHRDFELLFTVSEEVYCEGAKKYDYSNIKSKEAYVLDLSGKVGGAAYAAPTILSFEAEVLGKAAHAGFAPEEGIHAIGIAANAIAKLKQGRIDEESTANIGLIQGGEGINIVPSKCLVKGEVRSLQHNKALKIANEYKELFQETANLYGANLNWRQEVQIEAYETPRDSQAVVRFEKACEELDIQTDFVKTFGGSDNNVFAKHGISGLVLATAMNKVHSVEEYTTLDELVKISSLVVNLLTNK